MDQQVDHRTQCSVYLLPMTCTSTGNALKRLLSLTHHRHQATVNPQIASALFTVRALVATGHFGGRAPPVFNGLLFCRSSQALAAHSVAPSSHLLCASLSGLRIICVGEYVARLGHFTIKCPCAATSCNHPANDDENTVARASFFAEASTFLCISRRGVHAEVCVSILQLHVVARSARRTRLAHGPTKKAVRLGKLRNPDTSKKEETIERGGVRPKKNTTARGEAKKSWTHALGLPSPRPAQPHAGGSWMQRLQ